jgi:hypothetical protein
MKEGEFIHYLSNSKFLKRTVCSGELVLLYKLCRLQAESHRQAEGAIKRIASKANSQDNKYAYVYSELNVKLGPKKHKYNFSYDYSWTSDARGIFLPIIQLVKIRLLPDVQNNPDRVLPQGFHKEMPAFVI